jgi:hypothetical protein
MPQTEALGAGAASEPVWCDLKPVLDEEVQRLPEKYRLPVVLCYLEGQTVDEAARQLGCPRGTVGTRLARARERLRTRLARRGLVLTAGVLGTVLTERLGQAAVPARLVRASVQVAGLVLSGEPVTTAVSASTLTLSEGVLHTMFMNKLKTIALVLVTLGVLGTGGGLMAYRAFASEAGDGNAGEPGRGSKGREDRLQPLLQARLDAAREEFDARKKEFDVGRGTLDIVFGASHRILHSQKELNPKKDDQIAALQAHLDRMKDVEQINTDRFNAGRITIQDLKVAEYYRLDAEIMLERAKGN